MTRKGLVPALGAACRVALREAIPSPAVEWSAETRAHVDACTDCTARVHAGRSLATWLAGAPRPAMPEALNGRASEVLAAIHERVVERAESGPLGAWVGAAHVAMPEAAADRADAADAVVGDRALLASRLIAGPVAADQALDEAVWSQVRRSILDTVALTAAAEDSAAAVADGSARPAGGARVRWRVLFAGAAASIAIGFFAISTGGFATGGGSPGEQLPFVVVDLGRAPDLDYAVARFGIRH